MKSVTKVSAGEGPDEAGLSDGGNSPHRERILEAALALLSAGGRDAVTTRAVAEAAGVQPPVLYRLFADKRGLLDAVTDYGFGLYLAEKRAPHATEDPVQFLRDGWLRHIAFGLAHSELYLLMYADPALGSSRRSGQHAYEGLRAHMQRIAAAGRLRMPAGRAADLFHGAACGVVMTLLGKPKEERDGVLSQAACEAALAAIVTDGMSGASGAAGVSGPAGPDLTLAVAANTVQAHVLEGGAGAARFTPAETALLLEWLARLGGA